MSLVVLGVDVGHAVPIAKDLYRLLEPRHLQFAFDLRERLLRELIE